MEPIEVVEIPSGISDYLASTNRSFQRKPNHYWVSDICKCLRQTYYEISGTPPDYDVKLNIESLWTLQSRKFLHNLTYAYRWRELDIEKEIPLEHFADIVTLRGRLDMYDYKSETIIDLKTTSAVRWQHHEGLIPRVADMHQIQCYGTIFVEKVKISNLVLLYADVKNLVPFRIPLIDRSIWIKERLIHLHTALRIRQNPPASEPTKLCRYCKFKERCDNLEKINAAREEKS